MLRIKEQKTLPTLHEHDDDDDGCCLPVSFQLFALRVFCSRINRACLCLFLECSEIQLVDVAPR